ncbi:hypothetical protein AGMMS49940_24400 [Spirochaetia bacterium]|nr:hypothetical protein AGMMS49940_24400 [Spirochaetia bacterium]
MSEKKLSISRQTGTAILLVSHETDALNYCSRFFVMAAGKLTEQM